MKMMNWICGAAVAVATMGIVCPQAVQAGQLANAQQNPAVQIHEGGQLLLGQAGTLKGALVDQNGKGIEKAPVIIVRNGQVVAQLETNQEGQFQAKGLRDGQYLVATHDGIYRYQTVTQAAPGTALKQGAIIKVDGETARGKWFTGMSGGLLATLAIAGIVAGIIIATDDDDDDDAS